MSERRPGWKVILDRFPHARKLWAMSDVRKHSEVEVGIGHVTAYLISGRVFLLHTFPGNTGWEVYAPVCDSHRVDDTMNAIAARIAVPVDDD